MIYQHNNLRPLEKIIVKRVSYYPGSMYYPLFKFFNEEHGLIPLDSDIQEIIHEVRKFEAAQTLQCTRGVCNITDAGGMLCCHTCGWDDVQDTVI